MTRHEEDVAAVRRCLHGDPDAFRELLERYESRVFSLILRMVRCAPDAEDIAQDTFLKAFRNLSSYDPSFPFVTWLFKIAHNTSLDFLRRKKPQTVPLQDDEGPAAAAATNRPPDSDAESILRRTLIDGLFAALPPLYREALILRHKEGLELKEIAQVLGVPEGTVKIRLFRARERLRRALEAPLPPAGAA